MSTRRGAPGRLYLVPNLLGVVPPEAVLPQRTIAIARALTHFVVETPKIARQFLKTLGPPRALRELAMAELNEHTPAERIDALLEPALAGHDLGLLSDAGCPGVADPGAPLVAAAHRASVPVVPLVGPSAVLLALMACGMNGQAFAFHGYLPAKPAARDAALKTLDAAVARTGATQVFIETPYRNEAMVGAVLSACKASTQFCVAAGLTSADEHIVSRSVSAWRELPRPALAGLPAMFLLGVAA
jgi:16S rRNA (cytidine1402-2'-O)-methyltransferase